MMINDLTIDDKEVILVSIEQIPDERIPAWKPLLNKISAEGLAMVTIEAEKMTSVDAFNTATGENTVRIICTTEWFVSHLNELRELDEDGLLSVHRACIQLEDLYYNGE